MTIIAIKSKTLGEFNVALAASLGLLLPLAGQFDAFIGATLGPIQSALSAQLNAAISASVNLSLAITNPLFEIQIALASVAQLQASLSAALAFPRPAFTAELSTNLALVATLQAQLGGLQIALKVALKLKNKAISLVSQFNLNATVFGVAAEGLLSVVGSDLSEAFSAGLKDEENQIGPNEEVYAITLIAKETVAINALRTILEV